MKIYDYAVELSFDDYYENENDILFSSGTFNGLLRYSKKDNTINYVQAFGKEAKRKVALHHKVYYYNKKLFFMPDHSSAIHVYDIDEDNIKEIPVELEKGKKYRGIDSFRDGNNVYIFYGYIHNPCVVLNLETETIEMIDGVYACFPDEISDRSAPIFLSSFVRKDDVVYGAVWDSGYVFKYSLTGRQGTIIDVRDAVKSLSGLAIDEAGVFYFAERGKDAIVSYKADDGSVTIYESDWLVSAEKEKNGNDLQMIYCNLLSVNDKILLIPNLGHQIFCLDKNLKKVVHYADLPSDFEDIEDSREKWRRFYHAKIMTDTIKIFPCRANMVIDIGIENGTVSGVGYALTKEWLRTTYAKEFHMKSLEAKLCGKKVKETETMGVEELILYTINSKEVGNEEKEGKVGSAIWNMTRE